MKRKEVRALPDMSQKELAEAVHVLRRTINTIEKVAKENDIV